jgi:saccharopine dehydrogenase (NADP+, L-glutamate forming)
MPKGNPLDTLCATLEEKMAYEEGERDFVVSIIFVLDVSQGCTILTPGVKFLQHNFEIENKDGNSRDIITSTLCEYGAPIGSSGFSAMARLVGITCGVGKSSSVLTIFCLSLAALNVA